MSKETLKNLRIYLDGYELTTRSNTAMLEGSKDAPDVTVFCSDWKEYLGDGLKDFTAGIGGFMEIDEADAAIFNELDDSGGFVLTLTTQMQAVGGLVFFMHAIESSLKLFGNVGDVAPFQIGALSGSSRISRGVILAPSDAVSADRTGAAVQIAAAEAGLTLNIGLHVTDVSGSTPTLTMTIESDSTSGFSSPTTLYTSSSFVLPGAEYAEVTLASSDTYFRIKHDVGGTGSSFTTLASISII
jgi:hypothetical protein